MVGGGLVVMMVNMAKLLENIRNPCCREKQLTFADPGTAIVALYSPCHLLGE